MTIIDFAGAGLISVLAFMTLVWLLSLRLADASIVDRVWGLSFIVQSLCYSFLNHFQGLRLNLILLLISIWGIRLSWHIHCRNKGSEEDYRYQRMRARHGDKKFRWYSFFSVFTLQALISFCVASPILITAAYSVNSEPGINTLSALGIAIWITGFIFEAGGDWQLNKFKKNPLNKGKLLTSGFWSLSRHPNYFGDALSWWGIFVISSDLPNAYWGFVGPLLMTFFIVKISGVAMLEKDLIKKKPNYAEYIKNTPAFIPDFSKLWR